MKQKQITETITSDDSDSLKTYFKEIKDTKPLSAEEEKELARKIQSGDEKAFEKLINANLKFVVSVAKQYQNMGLPLPDLIEEGNIGLITAAQKFDGSKDCKFISYAVWWIRESILQALANTGRTIRLPMNQVSLLGKINKTIREFELKHGRTPSENEIADILDIVDGKKVSTVLEASGKVLSIDTPFSEDDDRTIVDTLDVEDDVDPDRKMEIEELRAKLNKVLLIIPPIEQYVISHIYGVGRKMMSLDDIAAELKKPRERVHVIKEKGIRHIKERTKDKALLEYLDSKQG